MSNRYIQAALYLIGFTGLGYVLMLVTEPDPKKMKEKLPERQLRAEDSEKRNQSLMNILKATSQGSDIAAAIELEKQKLKIEYEKKKLLEQHKAMLESRDSVKEE